MRVNLARVHAALLARALVDLDVPVVPPGIDVPLEDQPALGVAEHLVVHRAARQVPRSCRGHEVRGRRARLGRCGPRRRGGGRRPRRRSRSSLFARSLQRTDWRAGGCRPEGLLPLGPQLQTPTLPQDRPSVCSPGVAVSPGLPVRHRGVPAVGRFPPLLAAPRTRGVGGAARSSHPLVGGDPGRAGARAAPIAPVPGAFRRPSGVPAPGAGRRGHHRQLGHLHLRRDERPRGGDVARLLHQPARDGADGRGAPRRAAQPAPVARDRRRRRWPVSCSRSTTFTHPGSRWCSRSPSAPTGWPRSRPAPRRSRASPSRPCSSHRSPSATSRGSSRTTGRRSAPRAPGTPCS